MSNLINDIFLALTSYEVEQLKEFASSSGYNGHRADCKLTEFRNCLNGYKMDGYIEPLYYFMILGKKRNEDYLKRNLESLSNTKDQLDYKENLVNLLKILLSGSAIKAIRIKCKESLNLSPIEVSRFEDIKIIADAAIDPIWGKIEQLGLNSFLMTRKEAVAEINNHTDVEWTKRWMEEMGYMDPEYASFTLGQFEDYYKALHWKQFDPKYHETLRGDFIELYIAEHPIELPLNLKTVERILQSIKQEKSIPGRKEDTYFLKSTTYLLGVLKHAEQYLKHETVASILDIPVSSDDHFFIHDVLVFFGLLNTYRDKPENERILKKRIRKIIHDYNDLNGLRDIDEKFRILRQYISNPE